MVSLITRAFEVFIESSSFFDHGALVRKTVLMFGRYDDIKRGQQDIYPVSYASRAASFVKVISE